MQYWGLSFYSAMLGKFFKCCRKWDASKKENVKGKVIQVSDAPEPQDIFWENLGTPLSDLFWRRLTTGFLSILLLGVSFAAIVGLKYFQVWHDNNYNNMAVKTIISLVISFLISVINTILGMVLRILSYKEKYETKTAYNISLAKRIAFVFFSL